MSMYTIKSTSRFKRDYKALQKSHYDLQLLEAVIDMLSEGKKLPEHYHDHKLEGDMVGFRECHILNDWILIYKIDKKALVLVLSRTGDHSNLLRI